MNLIGKEFEKKEERNNMTKAIFALLTQYVENAQ
jgi:hypothetical protein